MQPKTYAVRLCRPFGTFTENAYLLYVHAESSHDALAWVARVFTGIDIVPTLQRWGRPRTGIPQVGNTDPVSIHDCDAYRSRKRVGGKFVVQETPPGHFRRSSEECSADLLKIFNNLQSERTRLLQAFEHFSRAYERDGVAWYRTRLLELKAAIERATLWQGSVWAEYWPTQQDPLLSIPVECQALAA
jgi:hypothetical protein